jgi:hypothetical protein
MQPCVEERHLKTKHRHMPMCFAGEGYYPVRHVPRSRWTFGGTGSIPPQIPCHIFLVQLLLDVEGQWEVLSMEYRISWETLWDAP